MRRMLLLLIAAATAAACTGATGSAAPTHAAVAPTAATFAPTPTPFIPTNPPPTLIPGCLPQCWQGRLIRPGAISGTYKTKYFFGGNLTITVPDGWNGYEDSTGELAVGRPNDDVARLDFWIDVYAAKDSSGAEDTTVERTGDAILAWFLDKPLIEVIKQDAVTIDGIPAVSVEYRRKDKAPTDDPACPKEIQPCTIAFGYPEWNGEFFGEGGPFHSKLIVADAMWGGQRHTIYVEFWADTTSYPELIDQVNAVIASIKLPAGVGPAT
ncbi:MAG TPA: hypothetical protein VFI15_04590 [Candidatus Limnocylindrales bacterium]|nr:hypothetical protein [Candidatus Limnocylindrales bacterium]